MKDHTPETDDDVEGICSTYTDPIFRSAMRTIYKARRGQGDGVLDSYIYMLRCHVDPKHESLMKIQPSVN